MKRRTFLLWLLPQRRSLVSRLRSRRGQVGILFHLAQADPQTKPFLDAIWTGFGKYGWNEKNLLVDYRFSADTVDVALTLAAELITLNPDLLVGTTTPPITALANLTQTIPIVFCFVTGLTLQPDTEHSELRPPRW